MGVDQVNALDSVPAEDCDLESDRCIARGLLNSMAKKHIKIESSTSNYKVAIYGSMRNVQPGRSKMNMFGGCGTVSLISSQFFPSMIC